MLCAITSSLAPEKGCSPVITCAIPLVATTKISHVMLTWYATIPNAKMSLFLVGLPLFRLKPEGFNSSGAVYRTVPTERGVVLPGSTLLESEMIATSP